MLEFLKKSNIYLLDDDVQIIWDFPLTEITFRVSMNLKHLIDGPQQ